MFEAFSVVALLPLLFSLVLIGFVVATLVAAIRALNAYTQRTTLETDLRRIELELAKRRRDADGGDGSAV